MVQNESRDHHVVPQMHLKWFAKDKWLDRFTANDDGIYFAGKVALRRATAVRDLNRMDDWTGEHSRLESAFDKYENDAAAALLPVLLEQPGSWPLGNSERNAVARWLALLHYRTPRMRAHWNESSQHYLDREDRPPHPGDLLESGVITGDPDDLARLETVWGIPRRGKPLPRNAQYELLNMNLPGLAEWLFSQQWILVRAGQPTFFTSDEPLVLTTDNPLAFTPDGNLVEVCGINYLKAKFGFIALSRTRALVTRHRDEQATTDGELSDLGAIRMVKVATLLGVDEVLFQHPDDSTLPTLAL